jgi:hypothetical protein
MPDGNWLLDVNWLIGFEFWVKIALEFFPPCLIEV